MRVLNVYSADGVLNQRTAHVPVKGLTLRVQTERETLGEMGEMLIMCRCCCVSSIQDQGSLVGKHCEMCINHEVYHLISGRALEAITEPVHRQVSGHHGIEEEILQFQQGSLFSVERIERCFVHVSTIHGLGCCAHFV